MNHSIPIKAGLLHVEEFLPGAMVLRLFRHPLAELDAESGQPKQEMDWCCTLWLDNGTLWIKGVMRLPDILVVRSMIRAARKLPGVKCVAWDTLDADGWAVTKTILRDKQPTNKPQ